MSSLIATSRLTSWCLVLGVLLTLAVPALAQPARDVRVRLDRGATSAVLRGEVIGRGVILYRVQGRAGQTLRVTFESARPSASFNVFAPGSVPGRDAALFIGESGGNAMEVRLMQPGDHVVQVFQNRAAARRGERTAFALRISITGEASAGSDATVPGTEFHATGTLPCARGADQPAAQCRFGVVRAGRGGAALTIYWPDGGSRVITFRGGQPVRFDRSQADGQARMSVRKVQDTFFIRVGPQRFEIPDAVVTGG